ncbi:unnamed protein product [Rotaria sordida]|uniref:BTB domain-containing protein n=1 Tax=Rotaria sordida TaxID=392033 RepID=A0A813YFL2_9BILA|nr:unnamed protein product [Rotaria sordida]
MTSENNVTTIQIIVRNESFELSSSLFRQFLEYSSSSNFNVSKRDEQDQIYLNVHPCIFNAYLLYIQSGYFVQPDYLSQEDLINGLRICGAPFALINHYEHYAITSVLSSHEYSCHLIHNKNSIRHKWLNVLILIGLFIAGCCLTIDLYRQILMLNKNPYEETSQLLIIMIYLIDSILFLYSCTHAISKFISNAGAEKPLEKDPYFITNIISCLGILSYFIIQRPITNVYVSHWNSIWIFIHICRTIRIAQLGYRLIYIQWCLNAIIQSFWTFLQTITGLFWILIFSGSMLYTMDMIENNQQYSSNRLTILSAHETLYTIGYRNNAPYGYLTRLWTIISIYFMSSIVQILLWWFQTKVTIQWKILLDNEKKNNIINGHI